MNNISRLKRLNNRYFAVNHGESEADVIYPVCGDIRVVYEKYGLTEKGIKQVEEQTEKLKKFSKNEIIICSSDFLRTKQTSKIIARSFGISLEEIILEPKLRERFFGEYEGKERFDYRKIYDSENGKLNNYLKNGIESIGSVLSRTSETVLNLERIYKNKKILLVSHLDPIRILQTAFIGIEPNYYKILPKLNNGEIKELILTY